MRRECWERFPRHRFQKEPPVSDPGMHHGTCVTNLVRGPYGGNRLIKCKPGKHRSNIVCLSPLTCPITMTSIWAWWRLKSPASRLFTQPFIQAADQRKQQSFASLAFVQGIHRWPVNSPHKWPVRRKMFPFGDVIMRCASLHSMITRTTHIDVGAACWFINQVVPKLLSKLYSFVCFKLLVEEMCKSLNNKFM